MNTNLGRLNRYDICAHLQAIAGVNFIYKRIGDYYKAILL